MEWVEQDSGIVGRGLEGKDWECRMKSYVQPEGKIGVR